MQIKSFSTVAKESSPKALRDRRMSRVAAATDDRMKKMASIDGHLNAAYKAFNAPKAEFSAAKVLSTSQTLTKVASNLRKTRQALASDYFASIQEGKSVDKIATALEANYAISAKAAMLQLAARASLASAASDEGELSEEDFDEIDGVTATAAVETPPSVEGENAVTDGEQSTADGYPDKVDVDPEPEEISDVTDTTAASTTTASEMVVDEDDLTPLEDLGLDDEVSDEMILPEELMEDDLLASPEDQHTTASTTTASARRAAVRRTATTRQANSVSGDPLLSLINSQLNV